MAEVKAAFEEQVAPRPDEILAPYLDEDPDAREFRDGIAEHSPQTLTAEYLDSMWPAFSYLSAQGYRYYLPALLAACLEDFQPDNRLIHSTLFHLLPNWPRLYRSGEDLRQSYQVSLFTPTQYAAVCAFLGLALDHFGEFHPWSWLAAKALRWRWNRQEIHPAQQAAAAFYERLNSFEYPRSRIEPIQTLIDSMRDAFDDTPYPGDDALCGSEFGFEPPEIALEFRGTDWRTLHPAFLGYHAEALSFLSHAGFRYLLPAYVITDLLASEFGWTWSAADPVFHLTHWLDWSVDKELYEWELDRREETEDLGEASAELTARWSGHHEYMLARLDGFTRPERSAIVDYLRHQAERDEYSRPRIEVALDSYWLPSLA